jgi:hypothetical protein
MASLANHNSLSLVKGLYLGNPGSGKTGSLDSLVRVGYKLFIYDFDNLLGSLVQMVLRNNPEKISNVHYQTFTDKMKGTAVPIVMNGNSMKVLPFTDGVPKAFVGALGQLTRWKTEEDGDLGDPAKFGKESIVVIDSLTNMSSAAFRYAQAMNPAAKEGQTYYFAAQQMILNVITLLFSEQFSTNVLVLAHLDYRENEIEVIKGFPRTIGSALKDQIAAYFNCVLLAEATGSGSSVKRVIRTNSTGIVDLKNPVSFKIPDTLPLETGLAQFFKAVTNYSPEDQPTT